MKRYLIFAGETYYPLGGWEDYVASADTKDDAIREATNHAGDWFHIVDTASGAIIVRGYKHMEYGAVPFEGVWRIEDPAES